MNHASQPQLQPPPPSPYQGSNPMMMPPPVQSMQQQPMSGYPPNAPYGGPMQGGPMQGGPMQGMPMQGMPMHQQQMQQHPHQPQTMPRAPQRSNTRWLWWVVGLLALGAAAGAVLALVMKH